MINEKTKRKYSILSNGIDDITKYQIKDLVKEFDKVSLICKNDIILQIKAINEV